MKITNFVYRDTDQSTPIRLPPGPGLVSTESDPPLTAAKTMIQACLAPSPGAPYSADKALARFVLSLELQNAKVDDEMEVPSDLIADIKSDILRLYSPIVAGQFVYKLDGAKK